MGRLLRGCLVGMLAFAGAQACSTPDGLEGADCLTDDDCWPGDACARTKTQIDRGAFGVCNDSSRCIEGTQHGCGCRIDDQSMTLCDSGFCTSSEDITTCICCNPGEPVEGSGATVACGEAPADAPASCGQ